MPPTAEITEGRANITFPAQSQQVRKPAQVSWVSDANPVVRQKCVSTSVEITAGSHINFHDEQEDDD